MIDENHNVHSLDGPLTLSSRQMLSVSILALMLLLSQQHTTTTLSKAIPISFEFYYIILNLSNCDIKVHFPDGTIQTLLHGNSVTVSSSTQAMATAGIYTLSGSFVCNLNPYT